MATFMQLTPNHIILTEGDCTIKEIELRADSTKELIIRGPLIFSTKEYSDYRDFLCQLTRIHTFYMFDVKSELANLLWSNYFDDSSFGPQYEMYFGMCFTKERRLK